MNALNTKNIIKSLTISGYLLTSNHLLGALNGWNPPVEGVGVGNAHGVGGNVAEHGVWGQPAGVVGNGNVADVRVLEGANVHVAGNVDEVPFLGAGFGGIKQPADAVGNGNLLGIRLADANMYAVADVGEIPLGRRALEYVKALLDQGFDVDAMDMNGDTLLTWAAREGYLEVVRELIARGADVTVPRFKIFSDMPMPMPTLETPLYEAVLNGNMEIVRALIEGGANVDVNFPVYSAALRLAISNENIEAIRALIENADLNVTDVLGWTLLHRAVWEGRIRVARVLLEGGADVNAKDMYGKTPLHWAVERGQIEVAGVLVGLGADVNARDKNGETPLYTAVRSGQKETARALVGLGADVDAEDVNGQTLLHVAARKDNEEVIEVLGELGADVDAKDVNGETPLHVAARGGNEEVIEVLGELGADVNAANNEGQTPLDVAKDEVKYFLRYKGGKTKSEIETPKRWYQFWGN